jgi:hypothetical protein
VLLWITILAACGCQADAAGGTALAGEPACTVAVLPFVNETPCDGAGDVVAGNLAASLRARGTCAVIGPDDLRRRLDDAGLTLRADESTDSIIEKVRQLGHIDAVVRGVVPVYSADTRYRAPSAQVWGYGVSAKYGFPLGLEDPLYTFYHKTAAAAAAITVIRVADGEVLYETPRPFLHRTYSRLRKPPVTYLPLRLEAADELGRRLLRAMPPMGDDAPGGADRIREPTRR